MSPARRPEELLAAHLGQDLDDLGVPLVARGVQVAGPRGEERLAADPHEVLTDTKAQQTHAGGGLDAGVKPRMAVAAQKWARARYLHHSLEVSVL